MESFNKNKNIEEQFNLQVEIRRNINDQESQKESIKDTVEKLKILEEQLHTLEKEFVEQYLKVNKGV
jgi:arginyl-tRNA synthetase